MNFSKAIKLLSVICMVEVSGVQAAEESTYINSSSVKTNIQNLGVYVTNSTVRLRQESKLRAEIPLHMIIGGALTKNAIQHKWEYRFICQAQRIAI